MCEFMNELILIWKNEWLMTIRKRFWVIQLEHGVSKILILNKTQYLHIL